MKSTHLVTVLGREIPVRSSAPEEKVRAVETFVNVRIEEIRSSLTAADPQLVAIIALLNIAESYLEQQAALENRPLLDARMHSLLDRLDKALGNSGLFRET